VVDKLLSGFDAPSCGCCISISAGKTLGSFCRGCRRRRFLMDPYFVFVRMRKLAELQLPERLSLR
jgi:hypothetical protein